ncbi:MAG: AzlD domain-containing protein [Ruminococcaceae bacterium]|nr:AzlD domain-containing protein [Oscillospiraceae bacterium]
MNKEFWIYLLILAGSTYLIRAIPFAAMKKKITNKFVCSFLYYIPYTVLAAMTFPAALYCTGNLVAAALGLAVGMLFALKEKGLTVVALVSSATVFAVDLLMGVI